MIRRAIAGSCPAVSGARLVLSMVGARSRWPNRERVLLCLPTRVAVARSVGLQRPGWHRASGL